MSRGRGRSPYLGGGRLCTGSRIDRPDPGQPEKPNLVDVTNDLIQRAAAAATRATTAEAEVLKLKARWAKLKTRTYEEAWDYESLVALMEELEKE